MTPVSVACVGSAIFACLVLPSALYLGIMAILARVRPAPAKVPTLPVFRIVVPAHNESSQIAATVQSLLAVDYPKAQFEVVVVADNCTDDTAALARKAGAQVMERQHATLKGKGYALEFAFDQILAAGEATALVVVDADTVVSPNLLQAYAARLAQGAQAVQAEYGVRNPDASWRTRLMAVALAMFHRLRSLARERLGVSAGLRGNGMCFSSALLHKFPHKAFGLVEDVEYGIALGLGGVRVAYADEAKVLGEMVSSAAASESQRQRWEGGRKLLVRQKLPLLMGQALRQRNLMLFDLALDLATPPLSYVGVGVGLGVTLEAILALCGAAWHVGTTLWAVALVGLVLYVVRGIQLSGLGFKAVTALAWAPFYIVWKVLLALKPGKKNQDWVRTQRENEP
jgi:1,2-diacylglycerol 3-beta-glucosyltransferase